MCVHTYVYACDYLTQIHILITIGAKDTYRDLIYPSYINREVRNRYQKQIIRYTWPPNV